MLKVGSRAEAVRRAEQCRAAKQSVGFTSGVFDLLHHGHVNYLEDARKQCDLLIVGINSDDSVRKNKGPLRPVVPAAERAAVVAGLAAVDFVFIFDEANNNENVTQLRPQIYFKAGDYGEEQLTSKPIVESHGGKVVLIPFRPGVSSTGTIDRVLASYGPKVADDTPSKVKRSGKVAFLDRDGTINREVHYLHEPEKFELLPGVIEALKLLQQAEFSLAIVTNQPGIGLGYFTKQDFFGVNALLLRQLGEAGVRLDKIYFCPHTNGDQCECRKPKAGMIERGLRELAGDPRHCVMFGDRDVDIAAGMAAGCRTVLVGDEIKYSGPAPDLRAPDLLAAVRLLLQPE